MTSFGTAMDHAQPRGGPIAKQFSTHIDRGVFDGGHLGIMSQNARDGRDARVSGGDSESQLEIDERSAH